MSLGVGDAAPDFVLPGTDGTEAGRRDYKLADHRGEVVVLVFYPGDNTPVCTRQLNTYTAEFDDFERVDATVLALSPQSIESHEGFIERQGGFAFPLLADSDKAVGRQYGVLGPVGFYRRSVFVIDAGGIIRYAHRAIAGLSYKPTDELVEAVRAASTPTT
jgi:thioredoxin-dependent peroxiredoxin